MKTIKRLFSITVLVFISVIQVSAGWVIRMKDEEGSGTIIMMVQDGKMRMDMGEAVTIILNTNTNNMTWISHSGKKFWTGSADDFRKQQKEMVRAMTGMDPDQTGDKPEKDFNIKIEKVGSGEILGYPVTHYRIYESDNLKEELWIAPGVTVNKEIDWKKMVKMLNSLSGDDERDYTDASEYESLMMKGYPLKTIDYADGEIMTQDEAEKVEHKNIPGAAFAVSQGYDKVATVTEFFKYMYGQQ